MLGKAAAKFRRMSGDFRYAMDEEIRELDRRARAQRRGMEAAANASALPSRARSLTQLTRR